MGGAGEKMRIKQTMEALVEDEDWGTGNKAYYRSWGEHSLEYREASRVWKH